LVITVCFLQCGKNSSPAPGSGGTSSPTLASISISPSSPTLQTGTTQQFTATGSFSDNSTQNLTSTATWSSSNAAVATISTAGVASALAAGTSTIKATSGAVSGTT